MGANTKIQRKTKPRKTPLPRIGAEDIDLELPLFDVVDGEVVPVDEDAGVVLVALAAVALSGPTQNMLPPMGAPKPTFATNSVRLNFRRDVVVLTTLCEEKFAGCV
jgi:hypothetical protein